MSKKENKFSSNDFVMLVIWAWYELLEWKILI